MVERVGLGIGVNPYATEVGTESRFHLGTYAAIQRLPAAAGALYGLLHILGSFSLALTLPGQGQDPLHIAIPVLLLQLEYGMLGGGWSGSRDPIQHGVMSARRRSVAKPAGYLRRRIMPRHERALRFGLPCLTLNNFF